MKKRKFQKSESKSKRKKGTLVGNTILLIAIAVLVVSMLFTLCAKIVDKNDAKEELSSASDELITIAPDDESEAQTEAPTVASTESPTDAPTEEVEVPTTWKYLLNGSSVASSPVDSSAEGWQYAVRDTVLEIPDGDWETGRVYTGSESDIKREVLTYGFSSDADVHSIRVEAPKAFRVAYTYYDVGSCMTYVYKVVDYPAGIHDLAYPVAANGNAVTVIVTYSAY